MSLNLHPQVGLIVDINMRFGFGQRAAAALTQTHFQLLPNMSLSFESPNFVLLLYIFEFLNVQNQVGYLISYEPIISGFTDRLGLESSIQHQERYRIPDPSNASVGNLFED